MLFGQLGEHEALIIVIAFLFLVVGVPAMGAAAAKLGTGTWARIKRWFSSD
jgi:hypothetical protein